MPANIWVYIDQFQGEALSASWETLGAACELGTGMQSKVEALVFGVNAASIAGEALARGATAALICDDATLADFRVEAYAALLSGLVAARQPHAVLAPATARARVDCDRRDRLRDHSDGRRDWIGGAGRCRVGDAPGLCGQAAVYG